jgi:peptidyl-prolyl cis-trans isomerase A (cyclophilin A)
MVRAPRRVAPGNGLVSALVAAMALSALGAPASATVIRFTSPVGTFNVRLYNTATPLTTANFLSYANEGDYTDTFIHRSVSNFIVQGGGFKFPSDAIGVMDIAQKASVKNEPGISNLRGTIAMAKLGGQPDSATNQWFISLADNSGNLDSQNGGFTVFGRVVGTGMTVVDAIAAIPVFNASGGDPNSPFTDLPLRNYTSGNILKANLVTFSSIAALNIPTGDYNFNGAVNAADLAVWKTGFGSNTVVDADGDGNAAVTGADFLVWQRTLGQNLGTPVGAVPEPAADALAGLALLAGSRLLRRSRQLL